MQAAWSQGRKGGMEPGMGQGRLWSRPAGCSQKVKHSSSAAELDTPQHATSQTNNRDPRRTDMQARRVGSRVAQPHVEASVVGGKGGGAHHTVGHLGWGGTVGRMSGYMGRVGAWVGEWMCMWRNTCISHPRPQPTGLCSSPLFLAVSWQRRTDSPSPSWYPTRHAGRRQRRGRRGEGCAAPGARSRLRSMGGHMLLATAAWVRR